VADFIGDVNIIEGQVTQLHDDRAELSWGEGKPAIRGMAGENLTQSTSAAFAVRPEKVAIFGDEPLDRHNRVSGVVEDIAYLGNMSTYYVRLESGALIKSQVANDRRIARRSITWGDTVWLSWTDTAGIVLAA
jgi:putrescine transport system ATP-binding protein